MDRLHLGAARWYPAWLVLRHAVLRFRGNGDFHAAATLAYYGFFALIPLLLLVVIVLSRLTLSSEVTLAELEALVAQLLPRHGEIIMREIYGLAQSRIWGAVSVAVLIWVVTPFSSAIRAAMLRIFRQEKRPGFFKARLRNLAGVLALLLLLVGLVLGKMVYSRFIAFLAAGPARSGEQLFHALVPMAWALAFVALFYRAFIPLRLRWTERLAGSVFTAVLLFLMRPAFLLVLRFNPHYGFAFGSLKAIFLLTVWVLYAFLVILMGAELMAALRHREALLFGGLLAGGPERARRLDAALAPYVRELAPGQIVVRQGDRDKTLYWVLQGSCRARTGETVLSTFHPGDTFGELSMLLDTPRSADVLAGAEGARVVAISEPNVDVLLREDPALVRRLLRDMARRLQATSSTVAS